MASSRKVTFVERIRFLALDRDSADNAIGDQHRQKIADAEADH